MHGICSRHSKTPLLFLESVLHTPEVEFASAMSGYANIKKILVVCGGSYMYKIATMWTMRF